MARRHRSIQQARSDRIPIWLQGNTFDAAVAGSGRTLLGQLNAGALAFWPFTVIRTRLEIVWESDQSGAAEAPMGAFGMVVVKETASAIGITAVPTPLSESDADYFVYQPMITSFDFVTAAGFDPNAGSHYTVDSKAMRKVGIDDDIVSVAEEGNGDGALISVMGRFLVKLH